MFFKNLTAFKITQFDIYKFEDSLDKLAFIACSKTQRSSRGFVNPIIEGDTCLHSFNNLSAFCFMTEDKILPAQVINQEAQEYIKELEKTRFVGKAEKTEIKEDVEQRLLPQAFSRYKKTYGYIDSTNNFLVIDSVSDSHIDAIVELLQRCEIKFEPVVEEETDILTHWFTDNANPLDVEIGDKCKLTSDIGDGVASISCQGSSMLNDNIKSFIDAGGYITELAIVYREELSMVVNTKLQFKAIKFLDGIKDLNNSDDVHSNEADLLLMSDIFADLINSMQTWQTKT
jgi:recombination associated protein RdgC